MAEVVSDVWAISIRYRLARVGRSRRLPWLALTAGLIAAAMIIGASLLALRSSARQERVLEERIDQLRTQVAEAASAAGMVAPAGPAPDFVQRLPAVPDARAVLVELDRSARSAGVALGSVQVQERAASAEQLARADMTVSLRGSYPKLKQVLSDVLGRFPNISLVQWRLRRATQPADLEATMVLALWGAAAGANPAAFAAVAESAASGAPR